MHFYGTDAERLDTPIHLRESDAESNKDRPASESDFTLTDTYPKTNYFFTTTNIIKSFVGLGILTSPFGLKTCGIIPGLLLIIINGFMNWFTVGLQ